MINPSRAYPNGVSNLMILSARGDLKTIQSFSLNSTIVRQKDQWGYSALDYAQSPVNLYLLSWIDEIILPFGVNQIDVSPEKIKEEKERKKCEESLTLPLSISYYEQCEDRAKKAIWRGLRKNATLEEINAWIPGYEWQQQCKDFENSLSAEEVALIQDYIASGYRYMNRILREDPTSDAPINLIISRMIPLPHDIIVFRGSDAKFPDYGRFISDGYLSTTVNEKFALSLMYPKLLRLIIPKGTRCLYLDYGEWEILLPHHLSLQILATHRTSSFTIYDAIVET